VRADDDGEEPRIARGFEIAPVPLNLAGKNRALVGLAHTADQSAGKALFEIKCGVCDATESSERRIGPALKGVKDGSVPSRKNATPDAILKQIENGGGGMPVFRELLTKDQKEDIIAYIMTL
jgi:mono/diheme cytochrome c family protein